MEIKFCFCLQVKIWFQNHRYKCKRASKERQAANSNESGGEKSNGDRNVKLENKDPDADSLVDPNDSDGHVGSPLNDEDFTQDQVKNQLLANYANAAHVQQQQQAATQLQTQGYPGQQGLQGNPVTGTLNDMSRCPVIQPALGSVANPVNYSSDANNLALFQNSLGTRW